MTSLNYFQRYSQHEDHITNNVLLMLRHLYRESPRKLEAVLNELIGLEDSILTIGVDIEQQVSTKHSRPDGRISQTAIDLRIEVKPHSGWNQTQLEKHANGFDESDGLNILLLLSTDANPYFGFSLADNVNLCSTTFEKIAEVIDQPSIIAPHESALREIYEDFYDVLVANDLIPNPYLLFAFGCALTMEWNIKNCAYYEPATRPTKIHVLNGFYGDKAIQAMGRANYAIIAEFENGRAVDVVKLEVPDDKREGFGNLSNEECLVWLNEMEYPHALDGQMRVYSYSNQNFVDMSTKKDRFLKDTKGGYQSGVWLNLKKWVKHIDPQDIGLLAVGLAGRKFGNDRGFSNG